MKLRFQADADFNETIVKAMLRREPSINFQTAYIANLAGLTDIEVLQKAASEGRLLVSHDRKTMPFHFAEFIRTENSPGVIIVPQKLPIATIVEDLLIIWMATEAEEWTNRIIVLPI